MFIYLDIETIPTQRPDLQDFVAGELKAPSNYKDPEKIAAYIAENKEKAIADTGLDGAFGEIICIGWAINDGEPSCIGRLPEASEADLLREFFSRLSDEIDRSFEDPHERGRFPVWVGHYITGFDLRFLWQRCVVNQVKPGVMIPYDAKPWGDRVFDTKTEWTGLNKTGRGSLDAISRALGYAGKGDMDGSKVWDAIKAGNLAEVMEYCKADVNKARLLHKRMTFQ